MGISRTLLLNDIKMKKKSVAELGHNDRLKIYVDTKKKLRLSPFFQNDWVYLAEILYGV